MRALIPLLAAAGLAAAADPPADRTKMTPEHLFKKADKNGDGKLSLEEFKTVYPSEKHAPQHFKKADKDGDGRLTPDEFKAALEAVPWWKLSRKTPEEWLKAADKNGDGFLSVDEFREIDPHKNHVENHFKKADKDGDGKLSLAELKAFIEAQLQEKD